MLDEMSTDLNLLVYPATLALHCDEKAYVFILTTIAALNAGEWFIKAWAGLLRSLWICNLSPPPASKFRAFALHSDCSQAAAIMLEVQLSLLHGAADPRGGQRPHSWSAPFS